MMYDEMRGLEPQTLLVNFKGLKSFEEQINFVLLVLYSLDSMQQETFMEEIKKLEDIFQNLSFMRAVRHRDAMVTTYPAEYFGKDYGEDDPFLFNTVLEKDINKISIELLAMLGRVITNLQQDNFHVGDET